MPTVLRLCSIRQKHNDAIEAVLEVVSLWLHEHLKSTIGPFRIQSPDAQDDEKGGDNNIKQDIR